MPANQIAQNSRGVYNQPGTQQTVQQESMPPPAQTNYTQDDVRAARQQYRQWNRGQQQQNKINRQMQRYQQATDGQATVNQDWRTNWPTNPNRDYLPAPTGAGANNIARPNRPNQFTQEYRRDPVTGDLIPTTAPKSFGQRFGDFSGFGDASYFIDWQMQQADQAQQAGLQSRQNAVDTMLAGNTDLAGANQMGRADLDTAVNWAGNGGPYGGFLSRNVQNLLTQPIFSATEKRDLQNNLIDTRRGFLDQQITDQNQAAAGSGTYGSGVNAQNLGRLYSEAGTQSAKDITDLDYKLRELESNQRLGALGQGVSLNDSVLGNYSNLVGRRADFDSRNLDRMGDRNKAIADIIAGTEYTAPDISNLLAFGLAGKQYNQSVKNNKLGNRLLNAGLGVAGNVAGAAAGAGFGKLFG